MAGMTPAEAINAVDDVVAECRKNECSIATGIARVAARHLIARVITRLLLIEAIKQRHGLPSLVDPFIEPLRSWWWLSFAIEAGWQGGAFVEASDFLSAISAAHRCGCNSGGEVRAVELGRAPASKLLPLEPYRFYTKDELEVLDGGVVKF